MKSVALFTVLLICVHLSLQIPELRNCPPDFVMTPSMADSCGVTTCHGPDSISGVTCPSWICPPGKQIGYKHGDNSKVYPECCAGPICRP